jgi:hypothetical protein
MANEVIDKEAALGNVQALLLQGKVNRKVVKQTVRPSPLSLPRTFII